MPISTLTLRRRKRRMPFIFAQITPPTPPPGQSHGILDSPTIGAIIGACGALLAATLGPPIAAWLKARSEKREQAVFAGLENTVGIMEVMATFHDIGAERVILWTGHNGGGLPAGGSPFYTSAVHRVIAQGHMDITANYQNILVDGHYIKMLLRAASDSERMAVLTTKKMPECQLRRYYEAETVVESLIIVLGVARNSLYYLSVARYDRSFFEEEKTIAVLKAQSLWHKLQGAKK